MSYKWKKIAAVLFGVIMFFIPYSVLADEVDTGPEASKDYEYSTGNKHSESQGASSKTWIQISDNTWTLDVNGDGKNDVTLKSSINNDGEQQWTYTFNVENNDTAYYVYEEMTGNGTNVPIEENYTSKGSDGKAALPQDPGIVDPENHSYTITNSRDHYHYSPYVGSLKLSKSINGIMSNPNQKFTFTIKLSGYYPSDGMQIYGNVPFNDGVAKVSIGNDESITIPDIPAGATYTITEDPVVGYGEPTKTGDTGTITANTESDAVFTNNSTYEPPKSNPGSFTLTKTVTGYPDDKNASYSFVVSLKGLAPKGLYSYGTDKKFTADDNGEADVTVNLKNGETAPFENLPAGATYQIVENAAPDGKDEGNYISSYAIKENGTSGTIAKKTDSNTEKNTSLSTAKETVESDENASVTFTNDYPAVQNLTIKKLLVRKNASGENETYKDDNAEFNMTIRFSNLPEKTNISSDYGKVTADEDGEASKNFKIKADGTPVVFKNVPAGAKYRITESGDDSYRSSYEIATADTYGKSIDGTIVKKSDSASEFGQDLSTQEETVENNESDTVTFLNAKRIYLPITGQRGITAGIVVGGVLILLSVSGIVKKKKI